MDEEMPPSAKNALRTAIVSSIFIGICVLLVVVFVLLRPKKNNTIAPATPSPTISSESSITSSISPAPSTSPMINNNILTHTSPRLKISFEYNSSYDPSNPTNTEQILIKEIGNRIYVYPSSLSPEDGQFIEVFQKDTTETVDAAIRRTILAGKDPTRCFVSTTIEGDKTIAEIVFPTGQRETDSVEQFFDESQYCSIDYAQTNGRRYFMEDKKHPERFFFISIGQYGIMVDQSRAWQDTIRILN